jgi:DNA invertase Pin-like site-specific DNA recombinase
MVWSIDRLGRSTHAVVNALADLEAAGVAIYADKGTYTCHRASTMLHPLMAYLRASVSR